MQQFEFTVVNPPTSRSLEELAYQHLKEDGILAIVIRKVVEEPSTLTGISFKINELSSKDALTIGGRNTDNSDQWVSVRLNSDPESPASVTITPA